MIKMLYEENRESEPVLSISDLSPPSLKYEISYLQQSHFITKRPFSWILLFQNMKDLLLQNEKLVWAQEKVQILVAICCSPPGCRSSQSRCCHDHWGQPLAHQRNLRPLLGVTPRVPGPLLGLWNHQITHNFLHPLNLLADCLIAGDLDSVSEAEAGSDSDGNSERELNEVHPPSSDFLDVSHNHSMRVAYRDLVPMTRLFSTQLPISEGDQRH